MTLLFILKLYFTGSSIYEARRRKMEISCYHDLQCLSKGSKVEVSSNGERLKGSYFSATIVEIHQKTPCPSSKTNAINFEIEYDRLLSEDGSRPLREFADLSQIRPLPPSIGHQRSSFELNDVVDAYHGEGWCVGVVDKVIVGECDSEETKRYRIRFEDHIDVIECGLSDLRPHFDLVGSKWIPSQKKEISCERGIKVGGEMAIVETTLKTPPNSEKPSGGEAAIINQSFPFVKSSPIWEFLDSSEVFKKTPQKPHFSPLLDKSEALREGLALAGMVNFSNLVKMTCQLKYNSPEREFEIILEALPELGKYGFDVEPLDKRVRELLSTKANIAELNDQVKDTEIQLMHQTNDKVRLETEMDEIVEKIDETCKNLIDLEQQAMEIEKDYEILVLGSNISELLQDARHRFQMLAASSFENE